MARTIVVGAGRRTAGAAILLALALACDHALAAPWLDRDGKPTAAAWQAVGFLRGAAADGLEPDDYGGASLERALEAARDRARPEAVGDDALEASLTTAMSRYLRDLGAGRVDPRDVHAHYEGPLPRRADPRAELLDAARAGSVAELVREHAPKVPLYAMLRDALARYRAMSGSPAWERRLPPPPRRALREGERWPGLALVAARLEALGDLAPAPPGAPVADAYDASLRAAVESFQSRHGLAPDGALGRETLAQLDVTPAQRARSIELTMERLRWTPAMRAQREIVVNVPEFKLRAYEVDGGRVRVRLAMKVIVGRALRTSTPLIDEDMRLIEFSPYWNVPPSIARNETVPRLRRDPGYWEREGFEFVTPSGAVLDGLDDSRLDAVMRGSLRIRQRPGPRNALGDIKFIFPNDENIYLHHTPAVSLFGRPRRDFSHGCIRVEDPVGLARFVLQDDPQWTEQRILDAMGAGKSTTIRLPHPLPVVIAYSTVVVTDGRAHFFADIYGHDRLLDEALARVEAARRRAPIQAQSRPK